jgi:uncharacterized protein (DUF2147 family)
MIGKSAILAMTLAFAAGSTAFAAEGPEGLWQTPDNGGVVQVSACGDALCGHVVTSDRIKADPGITDMKNQDASQRSRPLKGLPLFYGVKGGPTEWSGGSVYNPEDGKTYKGSIKLVDASTLKLTGCVFAPFCKTETWTRIK